MSKPAWLDDDSPKKEAIPVMATPSAPSSATGTSRPPISPRTTEKGRIALEEAGLGFLCEPEKNCLPEIPRPSPSNNVSPIPVVIMKKNGAVIQDETFTAKSNTCAPVHFLKRMQMAEAQKVEKQSERAKNGDVERTPAPPPRVSKPRKLNPKSVSTRKDDDGAATVSTSGPIGQLEEQPAVDLSIITPLTDEERERYGSIIAQVGLETVTKVFSQRFQHRVMAQQEALQRLEDEMLIKKGAVMKPLFDSVFLLFRAGLQDPVINVFVAAANSMRLFLERNQDFDTNVVEGKLADHISETVRRFRESNMKCREAIVALLNQLAKHRFVGAEAIIEAVCFVDSSSSSNNALGVESGVRSLTSRVEYCTTLIQRYEGILKKTWKPVMCFAALCLNSSNNKIRKNAITLTAYVHAVAGREMEPFLIHVNPATVKLLKQELGDNGGGSVDDMLNPSLPSLDQAEHRQEEDDLAAFEGETSLSSENEIIAELWAQSLRLRSAKCIFSSRWKMRERIIERLTNLIAGTVHCTAPPSKMLDLKCAASVQSISQMLEKGLADSVPAVISASLRAVKGTISFLPSHLAWDFVANFVPLLVRHHHNSQLQEITDGVLLLLSNLNGVSVARVFDTVAGSESSTADLVKVAPRLLQSRVELLQLLISQHQLDVPQALQTAKCMSVAAAYLEVPNPKVRSAVCTMIIEIHHKIGSLIEPYLSKMNGPAIEELRSRISTAAKSQRNSKAQRLFNFVKPLAESMGVSPHRQRAADGISVKDRVLQYQEKKGNNKSQEELVKKEEEDKKELEKITGANNVSMARTTPGKKSRLIFA